MLKEIEPTLFANNGCWVMASIALHACAAVALLLLPAASADALQLITEACHCRGSSASSPTTQQL